MDCNEVCTTVCTYLSSQSSAKMYATSSNEFVSGLLDSGGTSLLSLFQEQVHSGMCARIAAFFRKGTESSSGAFTSLCQLKGRAGDQNQPEKETPVDSPDHVVLASSSNRVSTTGLEGKWMLMHFYEQMQSQFFFFDKTYFKVKLSKVPWCNTMFVSTSDTSLLLPVPLLPLPLPPSESQKKSFSKVKTTEERISLLWGTR